MLNAVGYPEENIFFFLFPFSPYMKQINTEEYPVFVLNKKQVSYLVHVN